MTSGTVYLWLAATGLEHYAVLFERNRIGLDVPPHLTGQARRASQCRLRSFIAPDWHTRAGRMAQALRVIENALEQILRPEREAPAHLAVVRCVPRWLVEKLGFEPAQESYLASLDWVRKQPSMSRERLTAMILDRLWAPQGSWKEAVEIVARLYAWSTEGLDTKDLKEAKVLLSELSHA
jgi:hypothetical protein